MPDVSWLVLQVMMLTGIKLLINTTKSRFLWIISSKLLPIYDENSPPLSITSKALRISDDVSFVLKEKSRVLNVNNL